MLKKINGFYDHCAQRRKPKVFRHPRLPYHMTVTLLSEFGITHPTKAQANKTVKLFNKYKGVVPVPKILKIYNIPLTTTQTIYGTRFKRPA